MTHQELFALLQTTGLPVAYRAFKKAQNPPFIAFVRNNNTNIQADNKVHATWHNYDIELYTDKKDTYLEKIVADMLDEKEIYYEVDETYVESEKLHMVIFSIQI